LTEIAHRRHGGKRRTVIATALLLASIYVAAAVLTDANRLMDALRQLGLLGCAAVLALSAVNYIARFHRWQSLLSKLGRHVPVGRHLLYYLGGFAFTISPAKAGEAVRSMYLRHHGVTYAESMAAFFVERLLDLFAIVIMSSLIVLTHPVYRSSLIAASVFLVTALVCVCQARLPLLLQRFGERRSGRVAQVLITLSHLLRSARILLHPQPLLAGLFLGLIAWGAEGIGFYILCQGLHISGSVMEFVGIYSLAVLAGSVAFFLPAGIGGMELVMTTLLVELGAPLRTAIIATLLCRLATLWFAVILGVIAASAIELTDRKMRGELSP
jgi:glycosyltransferase 2 family protein